MVTFYLHLYLCLSLYLHLYLCLSLYSYLYLCVSLSSGTDAACLGNVELAKCVSRTSLSPPRGICSNVFVFVSDECVSHTPLSSPGWICSDQSPACCNIWHSGSGESPTGDTLWQTNCFVRRQYWCTLKIWCKFPRLGMKWCNVLSFADWSLHHRCIGGLAGGPV